MTRDDERDELTPREKFWEAVGVLGLLGAAGWLLFVGWAVFGA